MLTWAHMIDTAGAELGAHLLSGSQTKVCDRESQSIIEAEDVLRLQVAMINIERVAVLDCIKQLKKDLPDQIVLTEISAVMKDLRKEITVATVVHDDPGVL